MPTAYNILVEPRIEGDVPEDLALSCFIAAKDFLGKKHVNHFGRVFEGYDKECDTNYRAFFEILPRVHHPFHDILRRSEKHRIVLSGDDQEKLEEILSSAEPWQNLLERLDPKVMVYGWSQYKDASIPSCFAIKTPLGVQDSHVHLVNHNIIQFWKPPKDKHWYDFDLFRDYLWIVSIRKDELSLLPQAETRQERRSLRKEERQARRLYDKYFDAITHPEKYRRISLSDDAPTFDRHDR